MAGALPHVVHVISSVDPRAGGTTTQLVSLVRAQVELGMTVSVISTYTVDFDPGAAEEIQNCGAYLELVGPSTAVLAWHPKLSRVLRDVIATANIVHIHGIWEEIQHRAAVIARELDIPYLFSTHGLLDPYSLQQSKLQKQLYMAVRMKKNLNEASALHYADEGERQAAAGMGLNAPAIVQPYALDLSPFERLPIEGVFRRAFPHLGNDPYVLFLSRLHPRKGLDLLIPAFAAAQTNNAKLVIAGPASEEGYEPQIRKLVEQYKLTDRVVFTGMLEGKVRAAAYAEAEVLVLPSHQENFGIVVVEALACGTPVIVSDHVNLHKQIFTQGLGEVVPLDVAKIAAAITSWLADSDKCFQTGVKGREWAFQVYDAKSSALAWASHYDDIMRGEVGLRTGSMSV